MKNILKQSSDEDDLFEMDNELSFTSDSQVSFPSKVISLEEFSRWELSNMVDLDNYHVASTGECIVKPLEDVKEMARLNFIRERKIEVQSQLERVTKQTSNNQEFKIDESYKKRVYQFSFATLRDYKAVSVSSIEDSEKCYYVYIYKDKIEWSKDQEKEFEKVRDRLNDLEVEYKDLLNEYNYAEAFEKLVRMYLLSNSFPDYEEIVKVKEGLPKRLKTLLKKIKIRAKDNSKKYNLNEESEIVIQVTHSKKGKPIGQLPINFYCDDGQTSISGGDWKGCANNRNSSDNKGEINLIFELGQLQDKHIVRYHPDVQSIADRLIKDSFYSSYVRPDIVSMLVDEIKDYFKSEQLILKMNRKYALNAKEIELDYDFESINKNHNSSQSMAIENYLNNLERDISETFVSSVDGNANFSISSDGSPVSLRIDYPFDSDVYKLILEAGDYKVELGGLSFFGWGSKVVQIEENTLRKLLDMLYSEIVSRSTYGALRVRLGDNVAIDLGKNSERYEMNNNKYQPADKMLYKKEEASSFYVDLILKKGKPTHLLFKTLEGEHIFFDTLVTITDSDAGLFNGGKIIESTPEKIAYPLIIEPASLSINEDLTISWGSKRSYLELWTNKIDGPFKENKNIRQWNNEYHKLMIKKNGYKPFKKIYPPLYMVNSLSGLAEAELEIVDFNQYKIKNNFINNLKYHLVPGWGQYELFESDPWRKYQGVIYFLAALYGLNEFWENTMEYGSQYGRLESKKEEYINYSDTSNPERLELIRDEYEAEEQKLIDIHSERRKKELFIGLVYLINSTEMIINFSYDF